MARLSHDEARAQIAAYALDALPADEARALEAHLDICPECRADLSTLREAAAHLAAGPPRVPAPASLRNRVMEAIDAERAGGPAPVPLRGADRRWRRAMTVALAAAAAVIIVLAAQIARLEQRLASIESASTRTEQVVTLMADPATRTVDLAGPQPGSVRLIYNAPQNRGLLVASQLSDPGTGRVYQLWLIGQGAPVSAGVFRPRPGLPEILPVGADFGRYAAVAVSVERGPNGAPAPTSSPILVGKLPRG